MPTIQRYNFYTVEFEFDLAKSRNNEAKHGISFEEAQDLWSDPQLMEVPARTTDEVRHLVIGSIGEKLWSAVITYRGQRIRIISIRRSRESEKKLYEST